METNKSLIVKFHDRVVGTLADTGNRMTAFAYADSWLENGFAISPFSLPLEKNVFLPSKPYFSGLFGVFADSLPDGWGSLLVDRFLLKNHMNPYKTGNLNFPKSIKGSVCIIKFQPRKFQAKLFY